MKTIIVATAAALIGQPYAHAFHSQSKSYKDYPTRITAPTHAASGNFRPNFLSPTPLSGSPHDAFLLNALSPSLSGIATTAAAATSPILSSLSALQSPLGSVSVLAFVVVVHEMGHFLAARSLGISVQEFSVGVGPKLAGFTRRIKPRADDFEEVRVDGEEHDSIDFNLRLIPLGGYVRFPENYNATLAFEIEQENREIRREKRRLANEAKEVGNTGIDVEKRKEGGILKFLTLGKAPGKETEGKKQEENQSKNSTPSWKKNFLFNRSSRQPEEPKEPRDIEYYSNPDLLQNRPWQQRALVISGGVFFNFVLAFMCYFGELTVGNGLPHPVFDQGAVITQSPNVDGPSAGILRRGDVIVRVNGESFYNCVLSVMLL